jgi:hypothetical protein
MASGPETRTAARHWAVKPVSGSKGFKWHYWGKRTTHWVGISAPGYSVEFVQSGSVCFMSSMTWMSRSMYGPTSMAFSAPARPSQECAVNACVENVYLENLPVKAYVILCAQACPPRHNP